MREHEVPIAMRKTESNNTKLHKKIKRYSPKSVPYFVLLFQEIFVSFKHTGKD